MAEYHAAWGEGRFRVAASALCCGADWVVAVTGGTLPHVGAVSLAVYEPARDSATVSTMTVYTHRDDLLSQRGAKMLARALCAAVSMSVGIHLDEADPAELTVPGAEF